MSDFLDLVEKNIRMRGLLRPRQRVLVAVSGGLDSMVLLHALNGLAVREGWRLTVAHLNHQLRGRSSNADERLVIRTAKQLGLSCVTQQLDVRAFASKHALSLEMAARQLRHDFLARTAGKAGIKMIAVAHHADDQLELFFLRLLRGSGGEGLAGMDWQSASPANRRFQLIRPFLDQPKAALEAYAARVKIPFREDATNAVLDMRRNRIRHELLPLLRRHYQPALARTILRTMEIAGAEADFVAQVARAWLVKRNVRCPVSCATSQRYRSLLPNAQLAAPERSFAELPIAVQRRCIHDQLLGLGVVPEFDLIEELRANEEKLVSAGMMRPIGARALLSAGSNRVLRDKKGIVWTKNAPAAEFDFAVCPVDLEGASGEVGFAGVRIRWRSLRGGTRPRILRGGREYFDAAKVGQRIVLRHWQPGDRFHPIGMKSPVKLQDFFTNQKVPGDRRRQLLVATTCQGELFWVEGLRISERFKLTRTSNRRLQWSWQRAC